MLPAEDVESTGPPSAEGLQLEDSPASKPLRTAPHQREEKASLLDGNGDGDYSEEGGKKSPDNVESHLVPMQLRGPMSSSLPWLHANLPRLQLIFWVLGCVGLLCVPAILTYNITMLVTREGLTWPIGSHLVGAGVLSVVSSFACKRRKHAVIAFLVGLFLSLYTLHFLIFVRADAPTSAFKSVEADNKKIAIVGGGPSGFAALWMLKQSSPNRDVTLFEETHVVGGHSTTIYDAETTPSKPIDIGFIFSTMRYEMYMMFNYKYNVARHNSTIKVAYHGSYPDYDPRGHGGFADWDNMGGTLTHAEPHLLKDIQRFREFVAAKPTMFRGLCPLGIWLWYEGFSAEFAERVLRPLLTPLFVTAKGSMFQSAQATLGHFGPKGFLSLDLSVDANPPLFHTVGGVATMYADMLRDLNLPPSHARMATRVVSVAKHGSRQWQVTSFSETRGKQVEIFDEVILACNAKIQASILDPSSAGWLSWLLHSIDYDRFSVRLSATTKDDPVRSSEALYHIYPQSEMVGSIDRILDVGDGDYKLEVWPEGCDAPTAGGRVVTKRSWEHHRFSLWELLLTHRVLPRLNHVDGLHIAGDWTMGVGQNDALKSGIRAACAAGVPHRAKTALAQIAQEQVQIHVEGGDPTWTAYLISSHCPPN